ncbi:MAG: phosphoribosylanthranilate isomerase [Candidatus Dormibacteria bacterium]
MIVKVCGVRSAAVAASALDAGADWIGVVREPRSVRHASAAEAAEVAAAVRGRGSLVAVMVSPSLASCLSVAEELGVDAVQAHGRIDPSLALASPVPVIPAINQPAHGQDLVDPWWPDCLILLDAPLGGEELPGGTGRSVDLERAAALARHRRLILAGGLGPGNVARAIAAVGPAGVDASSGLESSPGVKDVERVVAYVSAARAAAGTR